MDTLRELSLVVTAWLQSAYPQLEGPMRFVSSLGEEEFYLLLMPLIYWCLNKRLGRLLGYIFLVSVIINPMIKSVLRQPRPYWLIPDLGLRPSEGYGMPSNHVQQTAVVFFFLAAWLRRRWLWAAAVAYVLLMALSRVYLGAHFILDTVVGFLLALTLLALFGLSRRYLAEDFSGRILGQRLLVVVLIPVALGLVYVIALLIAGQPDMNVLWVAHIPAAELNARQEFATGIGALLGFGVGIMFESSRVRFRSDGPIPQRIGRYVLGIAVTIAVWAGLDAIFPAEPLWLALPLRILRYFLVLLWVAYYAPWTFVKLRLAAADPEPEISLKL